MKNVLFIACFLIISCKNNTKMQLRSIKNNLKNSTWEILGSDSLSNQSKKNSCVFTQFSYYENSLVCYQQFNNSKSDYVGIYFTNANGRMSLCGTQTSNCNEVVIKKDTIKLFFKDYDGKAKIIKYTKIKR